jgi:periplasmic divalent cation tolerance protein
MDFLLVLFGPLENVHPKRLFRPHAKVVARKIGVMCAWRTTMEQSEARYGLLMTTTANKDDAQKIAKALLAEKLAACVQLMPIESFYTWKGAVANDAEILLLVKTKTALFDDAIRAIKAIHPYETPEIVATPFTAGFAGYFGWIDAVTR